MNTPLDEHALDFLDDNAKRLVKEMLQAIVEHPNIYPNGFQVTRSKVVAGDFEYFLASNGGPGPFRNNQRLPSDITSLLQYHRFVGPKINPQWPRSFLSFTDAALEWYRTYEGITPDEVRKSIGRILRLQGGTGRFIDFDTETVAAEIGTTPHQVREQFEILWTIGLVEQVPVGDDSYGVLGLSKPNGLLWAERGYPSIHSLGMQTINVAIDLHVEVHNIIEQARATNVSDELVREFEAFLHRAEEELLKPPGQGKFQRVKELTEFAANVKEFIPLVGRLFVEHGDKIQQLADAAS